MSVPVPVVLLLCAASAGVAFFFGRTAHPDRDDEEPGQGSGIASAPALSAMGNADRSEGTSNPENAGELLGAFREVYGKPFAKDRVARLCGLVAKMDVVSLAEAWDGLSLVDVFSSGPDERPVADAIIRRWLALDREGALAFVKEMAPMERSYAYWSVAEEMAESDAEEAIAFARGLDDGDDRQGALQIIVRSVATENPEKAWAIVMRATSEKWSTGLRGLTGMILEPLARTDPKRALEMLSRITDKQLVIGSLGNVLKIMAKVDPAHALAWIAGEGKDFSGDYGSQIVSGWAESDPAAAGRYALAHLDSSPDGEWIREVARAWAQNDADAALGWIDSLEDEKMKGQAASAIIMSSKLIYDPERLGALFERFPDSRDMMVMLPTSAHHWVHKDAEGGLEWAAQSGLPVQHLDAFRARLIETWAVQHPTEAAARLGEITDPRLLQTTAERVVDALARGDLVKAAEWAAAQPPGPVSDGALASLASFYARRDLGEASAWLSGIPDGANRDAAVLRFVDVLEMKDTASAWEWGQSITDPMLRSEALEGVAVRLLARDPVEGALQIRESPDLSEEAKWRLLERKPKY